MNKLAATIPFALLATSIACAADITLKDGRVLRDAAVINEDAATVTIRHTSGLVQVDKAKLPESLAAEHPADAAQAKLEAERLRSEAAARDAAAKQLYLERLKLAAAANALTPAPVEEPPKPSPTDSYTISDGREWRREYTRNNNSHERRRRDDLRRRDCDNSAPAPRPYPEIRMTPDVHFGPSVQVVRLDPPASEEIPPDSAAPPPPMRRLR
jgi:hypothetical protein